MAIRSTLLLAITLLAASSAAAMVAAQEEDMSLYQQRDPCPQVERIVQKAVAEEFRRNGKITAGLLRVFFHDCFTGGCDASIFLPGEWDFGVNKNSVQEGVRILVNKIREEVNKQCGDQAVSCADILALATRDAVVEAKGPKVDIRRGRFDSLRPGTEESIRALPNPFASVGELRTGFAKFGLNDPADLVALSGGHTVGKTTVCGVVTDPFKRNCDPRRGQDLDVLTPMVFDNKYFVGLTESKGMFRSDQNLFTGGDAQTRNLVLTYARDQNEFFKQWSISMKKLSNVNWLTPRNGQIRLNCTRPNTGRLGDSIIEEVGFAASA